MLIPVGVMAPQGPPTDLQIKMRPTLMVIVTLQGIIAFCRFVVLDIWGGLSDLMVVAAGYFASSENSITYVMLYGLVCAINSLFDFVNVAIRASKWKEDYFNPGLGFDYNMRSFTLLAAAVTALTGSVVCYAIWRDYQRNAADMMPIAQQGGGYAPYGQYGGAYGNGAEVWAPSQAPAAQPATNQFSAFGGHGHRLGGEDDVKLPPPPVRA
mmetsp:Transcript_133244/g.231562  ORF Transcript_133244/g.231562 Transcript_133244/m.231562 type:complete len:211 (+) Transcript_133244:72-704(+)